MRVRLAFVATRSPWSAGRARATSPPAASQPRLQVAHRQNANHKRSPGPKSTRADCPAWPFAPARETVRRGRPCPIADREAGAAAARPASPQSHPEMAFPTRFPHSRGIADASSYSRRAMKPPNSNQLQQLMNVTDRGRHRPSLKQKMAPSPSTIDPVALDKQRSAQRPALRADPAWPRPIELRRCSRRSEEHTSELQSHLNLVCRL